MNKIETLDAGDCIRTRSGAYVNVFEPEKDKILLSDIVWGLSHQSRFSGHLKVFYSVLQHSIDVYERTLKYLDGIEGYKDNQPLDYYRILLQALMHDASEAFLVDIPTPIKQKIPFYKEVEHFLMLTIGEKFDFEWPIDDIVKRFDREALEFEFDHLMLEKPIEGDFRVKDSEELRKEFVDILVYLNLMIKYYKGLNTKHVI